MSDRYANLITNRTAAMPGDWKKQPARGRARHVPGQMNKSEARYAAELESKKNAGEIVWYAYEPVKLRLAERTFYTPDFLVMLPDGRLEFHEVKGFMEDDAAVKWKVAQETYWMFSFVLVKTNGRQRRAIDKVKPQQEA